MPENPTRDTTFFQNSDLLDPLLNIALVLTAGIIGGEIFARFKLPKVTGWIATGIILRQLNLPGMDLAIPEETSRIGLGHIVQPYMNFVLGFIAFTVGASLYFGSLRNTWRRIGSLLLCEAIITPVVVGAALFFLGPMCSPEIMQMSTHPALLLAAIAIAGAPGTTVLVIQEARAKGNLSRTLLAAIGLIDMVAVALFVFVSTIICDQLGFAHALQQVGVQFGVTLAVGAALAVLASLLARTIVSPAFLGPLMVAVILGAWGAAAGFGTSGGILACTFAGIALTNLRHDLVRSGEAYLASIGGTLFALFYTFAGMKLDFSKVPIAIGLVALYFLARLIGKSLGAFIAMSVSGATKSVRNNLGLALMPHGGVAVGLILLVGTESSGFSQEVKDVVTIVGLATLAVNQLLGPSATRFALSRAGEDHKDRPRLLDFLQENRIVCGLQGSKEEVFEQLTSLLYSNSPMNVSREEFLEKVQSRDALETTCLGNGLMIPHAILKDMGEDEVKGVLGLSSKGLDLGAPDGRIVHAVLLLVTPEANRKRHLEVIAAFASAITRDINIREQLYHAYSAGHAYDVLHADDLSDLNYFLEDAQERAGIIDE